MCRLLVAFQIVTGLAFQPQLHGIMWWDSRGGLLIKLQVSYIVWLPCLACGMKCASPLP